MTVWDKKDPIKDQLSLKIGSEIYPGYKISRISPESIYLVNTGILNLVLDEDTYSKFVLVKILTGKKIVVSPGIFKVCIFNTESIIKQGAGVEVKEFDFRGLTVECGSIGIGDNVIVRNLTMKKNPSSNETKLSFIGDNIKGENVRIESDETICYRDDFPSGFDVSTNHVIFDISIDDSTISIESLHEMIGAHEGILKMRHLLNVPQNTHEFSVQIDGMKFDVSRNVHGTQYVGYQRKL